MTSVCRWGRWGAVVTCGALCDVGLPVFGRGSGGRRGNVKYGGHFDGRSINFALFSCPSIIIESCYIFTHAYTLCEAVDLLFSCCRCTSVCEICVLWFFEIGLPRLGVSVVFSCRPMWWGCSRTATCLCRHTSTTVPVSSST